LPSKSLRFLFGNQALVDFTVFTDLNARLPSEGIALRYARTGVGERWPI
jgi:hypothetical protein